MKDITEITRLRQNEKYLSGASRRKVNLICTRHLCKAKFVQFLLLAMLLGQTGCNPFGKGLTQKTIFNTLELEFYADRSQVAVGEAVHMRFTVTNTSKQPWAIKSKDTPVLDIIVENPPGGQLLLSWSSQNPDKALHRVEWQPGESKVLELQWTPDDRFRYGRLVHLTGTLSENSKMIQDATVSICAGPACR